MGKGGGRSNLSVTSRCGSLLRLSLFFFFSADVRSTDDVIVSQGTYHFSKGGFQGNIGQGGLGGEWYVENVLEELDSPTEWFYDGKGGKLYYFTNGTNAPPAADDVFEAVTSKILLNYTGTQEKPITNISVRGVTIRDTAYTYLDPHGAPSGGDWGLQPVKKAGNLFPTENLLEGTLMGCFWTPYR